MKSRRGLSTVVGAVFAIIALATVMTYIAYSMNTLQQFNQEVMTKNTEIIDKSKEEFSIVKAQTTADSKFNITVQNSGNLPINITRLYIENKTNPNWGTYKYDVNVPVSPGNTATNIGQNLNLYALNTQGYGIKMTTARGNAQEVLINSPSQAPLYMQLYALPDTLPGQFTTTIILAVTNNMSNKNILLNIAPNDPLDEISGNAVSTKLSGPDPQNYESLANGDTAYFKWIYRMNGAGGETKTFSASLVNGYPGNTATAAVTLSDVTFSLQSGTALESQGLSATLLPEGLLVFHQETQDAASGRQMYAGSAENPTTLDTFQTQTFTFFTRNDTQSNVDVSSGMWNATLRIISKAVPDGIAAPSLIYHFESETSSTTPDSSGNAKDMALGAGTSKPTRDTQYGVNGTVGYHFDGGDYMEGLTAPPAAGIEDIGIFPDTTAGWFRTTNASDAKKVIYRVGSGTTEWYEIAMGDGSLGSAGKVFFKYSTTSPSSPQGNCASSSPYNNGGWHHFTAVRNGAYTCVLYIDGNKDGEDTDTSCVGCSGSGFDSVGPAGKTTLGRNPNNNQDYFTGDLDDIFHWNSAQLSQTQAQAMEKVSYGADAHKLDFKLERTDSTGLTTYENLKSNNAYLIPFWDGKGSTSAAAYSVLQINYTTGPLGNYSFYGTASNQHDTVFGDRLKFTITRTLGTSSLLNMSIRIDDPNMNNPPSSFLQTPTTDDPWPSYYILDNDDKPQVSVYNQGPYSSWISYLTRLAFDDITSTDAYAGHINEACGSSMDNAGNIRKDSPLIKVGVTCLLKFEQPRNPPDAQASGITNLIPPGQYRVNIFLSGYDETGRIFLRTTYVGVIRVID